MTLPPSTETATGVAYVPMAVGRTYVTETSSWLNSYLVEKRPLGGQMTYPGGVVVVFDTLMNRLEKIARENAKHRGRLMCMIESGEILRDAFETFQSCDRDGNGVLEWNNGEIRDFIAEVFRRYDLTAPTMDQCWELFQLFDADKNQQLDVRECLYLVDSFFRAIFYRDAGYWTSYGHRQVVVQQPRQVVVEQPRHVVVQAIDDRLAHSGDLEMKERMDLMVLCIKKLYAKPLRAGKDGMCGVGMQGPPGRPGQPGSAGLDGVGAVGPMGAPGPQGACGERGLPGMYGEQGLPGFVGEPGLPGFDGPPGHIGPCGMMGPPGHAGPSGAVGADGLLGPCGPTGMIGIPGEHGTQGSPGFQGPCGKQGPCGEQGSSDVGCHGPAGPPGACGMLGPQGDTGSYGAPGEVGLPGFDGPHGPVGMPGAVGPAGPCGPVGSVGACGFQGACGPPGPPGPQGPCGEQGLQGFQGACGQLGPPGHSGACGREGPPGFQGPAGASVSQTHHHDNRDVKSLYSMVHAEHREVVVQQAPQVVVHQAPREYMVHQTPRVVTQQVVYGPAYQTANTWLISYAAVPRPMSSYITYPGGIKISFEDFGRQFANISQSNAQNRSRILPMIESGGVLRDALEVYRACDRDGNGVLEWSNGEVRNFITAVFTRHGLSPPTMEQCWELFNTFDRDQSKSLDVQESLCLVDAVYRSVFYL